MSTVRVSLIQVRDMRPEALQTDPRPDDDVWDLLNFHTNPNVGSQTDPRTQS